MNHVLLLTATIAPRSGYYSADHAAPRLRLDDYRRAFAVYLDCLERETFATIVFAENSGHDLAELRALAVERGLADRVIFLPVAPGPVADVNVFYLELDLLIKAFAAPAVAALPADTLFWKVTGRYIVENIDTIVRTAPDADVYVNCRNRPIRWADFYLAAFTRRAFIALLQAHFPAYHTIRSGEEIFRETVDAAPAQGFRVTPRLRHVPRVSGARGRDRFNYGGAKGRLRYLARVAAHKVLPGLWI